MKLIDNSIIESNDQNYFIHPLLSRIYRFKLSDTEILSILESYFEVFQETFPNPNSTLLNECDFFSPHVLQMTTFLESHKDVFQIGKYLYFFKNFLHYLFLRKNYSSMDKVFRLVTRLAKPESEDLGIIFISMAKIYEELDMLPRAKLLLNEAKSIVNKYDKLTEKGRFLWGMYVEAEGHIAEAENHNIKKALNKLNEAISLLERDKFALTNEYASMLNCYGNLLLKDKQFLLAKNAYEKTLLIRELNNNKKTYEIASSYNNIGLCLLNLGDIKESRIYLAKALVVFKELLGEYHLDIAIVYYNLGLLFYRKKNNLRSMVYLEKAIEILSILEKAAFDDEQSRWEILSRKKMEVLKSYLAVAYELKEYDKIASYEEAFLKHISKSKWEAFNLLDYIAFIAQAHEGRNDIKNAIKVYNEIVDYLLLFDIEKTDLIIVYRIKLIELFFLKTNNIKEATKIYNQIVEMGRGNLEENDYKTVLKSIEMILYG